MGNADIDKELGDGGGEGEVVNVDVGNADFDKELGDGGGQGEVVNVDWRMAFDITGWIVRWRR